MCTQRYIYWPWTDNCWSWVMSTVYFLFLIFYTESFLKSVLRISILMPLPTVSTQDKRSESRCSTVGRGRREGMQHRKETGGKGNWKSQWQSSTAASYRFRWPLSLLTPDPGCGAAPGWQWILHALRGWEAAETAQRTLLLLPCVSPYFREWDFTNRKNNLSYQTPAK